MTMTEPNLESIAQAYSTEIISGWEKLYRLKSKYSYEKLKAWARPGAALELGCADGAVTEYILKDFDSTTIVDGSMAFLNEVKARFAENQIDFVHSLFEDYEPARKFDSIFMLHILEHLDDAVSLLARAKSWLSPGGRILALVPNADSLHRHVGVKLGMIPRRDALNAQDLKLGHRRVYTFPLLREHAKAAGLKEVGSGGIMVKPLSNRQIDASWNDDLIQAFLEIGNELPEICSEIFLVLEAE